MDVWGLTLLFGGWTDVWGLVTLLETRVGQGESVLIYRWVVDPRSLIEDTGYTMERNK